MNILLVEANTDQAVEAEKAIEQSGRNISKVDCGASAVRFLETNAVDLVILDWQLPDMTGFDVLRWIRRNLGDEPAVLSLMITVLEVDIFRALDAGANEYVIKPFMANELTARVGALLCRTKTDEKTRRTIKIGPYVLDTVHRSISLYGKSVSLTAKEFDIASCIFTNAGQVVPRDILVKRAWGRDLGNTSRTIDTHIYRLRQKLALRPENGVQLSTVYTHGYRLVEVDRIADGTGSAVTSRDWQSANEESNIGKFSLPHMP